MLTNKTLKPNVIPKSNTVPLNYLSETPAKSFAGHRLLYCSYLSY